MLQDLGGKGIVILIVLLFFGLNVTTGVTRDATIIINPDEGNYLLDAGFTASSSMGQSIDQPETFINSVESMGLGSELDTVGGKWFSTICEEDYIYNFIYLIIGTRE